MFLIFVLYALFGFTFTLGKIILSYAQPFFIVAARMLIGGVGLMSYIYLTKKIDCYPRKTDVKFYIQATLFGILIPYCCRAWALQYISTGKSAFLFNLMPFFTALFAYIFLKEKLNRYKITGLIIGFTGMIPILITGSKLENSAGSWGFLSLPEVITLVAVASFGYHFIVMQNLVKHRGCAPILANGISMLWGGILAFSGSLLFESNWIKGDPKIFLILLFLQILISNIICLNLQAWLLTKYSSTFLSFASFLSPLFASFYGWLFLGEKITINFLLSLIIVITGLGTYYYGEFKQKREI
jgi:drug/metabolite transporter (DMT)-like permease